MTNTLKQKLKLVIILDMMIILFTVKALAVTIQDDKENQNEIIITTSDCKKVVEETKTFTISENQTKKVTEAETKINKKINPQEKTITTQSNVSNVNKEIVYYDVPLTIDEQNIVYEICLYYNIDVKLVYQIIRQESNWNEKAVSKTNDHGLMQLNGRYYNSYKDRNDGFNYLLKDFNIYNKIHNILLGVRQLAEWKKVCNSKGYYEVNSMLECYNRGYGYFDNTSNTRYSNSVLSREVKIRSI